MKHKKKRKVGIFIDRELYEMFVRASYVMVAACAGALVGALLFPGNRNAIETLAVVFMVIALALRIGVGIITGKDLLFDRIRLPF